MTRVVVIAQAHQPVPPGSTRKELQRGHQRLPKKLVAQRLLETCCERGNFAAAAVQHLQSVAAEAERRAGEPPGRGASGDSLLLRFPSIEFRSLCLNPLAKSELMHAFPLDRGIWNRHKIQLASLLLDLSAHDQDYKERLAALVEASLERECCALRKNKQVAEEEKEKQRQKIDTRRAKLITALDAWCRATVKNPNFQVLRPVLEQVLTVDPAPQVDNKRDGQRTELEIASLLSSALPTGWTLHTQARVVSLDGVVFRNEKMVKGEADILIADPYGIVQAIVEIKTAKGNPYLALYEDLQRFQNLVERVRGRLVAFVPSAPLSGSPAPGGAPSPQATSSPRAAAPSDDDAAAACRADSATAAHVTVSTGAELAGEVAAAALAAAAAESRDTPLEASGVEVPGVLGGATSTTSAAGFSAAGVRGGPTGASSSTTGSQDGESTSNQSPVVTLRFSKNVKPVYVLGSSIAPEELGAVVRSAQSKLLTMEFGRVLSTRIDAWRDVSLVEINREAAVLQVPTRSFPQCADNVESYFHALSWCDIFMVQTA